MTRNDWFSVLGQAAEIGVSNVTLIGGEPTLYPHAIEMAERALVLDMEVEVYSNLVHVSERWWAVLQRKGMSSRLRPPESVRPTLRTERRVPPRDPAQRMQAQELTHEENWHDRPSRLAL